MDDKEAIQMMQRVSEEIKSLRRTIEQLAPKADAYDAIRQLQHMMPRPSQGMGEDLAWKLDREIEILKTKQAPPTSQRTDP